MKRVLRTLMENGFLSIAIDLCCKFINFVVFFLLFFKNLFKDILIVVVENDVSKLFFVLAEGDFCCTGWRFGQDWKSNIIDNVRVIF